MDSGSSRKPRARPHQGLYHQQVDIFLLAEPWKLHLSEAHGWIWPPRRTMRSSFQIETGQLAAERWDPRIELPTENAMLLHVPR